MFCDQDKGSLSSVNLLKNTIGDEQMQSLIKIKKEKGMVSLCGLHQAQMEADFSNQGLGAEDAKLIASDIQDMGSLSKLKMDKCELPVQEIKTTTELNLSNKGLSKLDAIMISVLIKVLSIVKSCWTN